MVVNIRAKAAIDNKAEVVTSIPRQNQLFESGFRFEACFAQAAFIEALCFLRLIIARDVDKIDIGRDIEKQIEKRKLTFGKTVGVLRDKRIIPEDSELYKNLKEYVDLRNELAHHLIKEFKSVEYNNFYEKGKELFDKLGAVVLAKSKPKLKRKF